MIQLFAANATASTAHLNTRIGLSLIYMLVIPVSVPAVLSAYSVVGEREQGTLEPVLTTPIRREEFLIGKALAAFVPALVIAYTIFGIFLAVAALFARSPNVIGYEAMNEPWPGADWSSCLTGCADLEASRLAPFYARMTAAVRSVDRRHPVLVEPFVLFNFGNADTSLPGPGSPNVLSTHVYALDAKGNASAMDRSVAAAERDRAALLVTEWGAMSDPAALTQTENDFDDPDRDLTRGAWGYRLEVRMIYWFPLRIPFANWVSPCFVSISQNPAR